MNEQLLLPVAADRHFETNFSRADTDNREITGANMPPITSTDVHSLQFPSHRSIVENLLITFASREKLLIDAQILEQHRFIIESVIHADYRIVPDGAPLANSVRQSRGNAIVVLGHDSSFAALKELAASSNKLEFTGKLILSLPEEHRLAAVALEYPNAMVVSGKQFSTSSPELYRATRMMGKIRGITGSSNW